MGVRTQSPSTRSRSADHGLDPYYERIEEYGITIDGEDGRELMTARCFDDQDELGVLHVQYRAGRRAVATFHGTAEEFREFLDAQLSWLDETVE